MAFLTLNTSAVAVAIIMGVLLALFGRNIGFLFVVLMLYFLVLSAIVTRVDFYYKVSRKLTQRERGAWNVVANGFGPLIFAGIFFIGVGLGSNLLAVASLFGFFGAVASITADKFGSELGVLDGIPRMILTMKKVSKGTSGGITAFGLGMGVVASLLVAALAVPLGFYAAGLSFSGITALSAFGIVVASGLFGTLIDSVLGYFEEKGTGNKYTSNFVCSLAGGLLGVALILLLL